MVRKARRLIFVFWSNTDAAGGNARTPYPSSIPTLRPHPQFPFPRRSIPHPHPVPPYPSMHYSGCPIQGSGSSDCLIKKGGKKTLLLTEGRSGAAP